MPPLITLEEARRVLGFDSCQYDYYTFLIKTASAYIERKTRMKFVPEQVTDILDGGFNDLILNNRPIVGISSITDYAEPDNPKLVSPADYTVYPQQGIVKYTPRGSSYPRNWQYTLTDTCGNLWGLGAKRWEVIYIAGFSGGVPDDIKQAVIMLLSFWGASQSGGAFQAESIGDYSYQLGGAVQQLGGVPPTVADILRQYIEVSF